MEDDLMRQLAWGLGVPCHLLGDGVVRTCPHCHRPIDGRGVWPNGHCAGCGPQDADAPAIVEAPRP